MAVAGRRLMVQKILLRRGNTSQTLIRYGDTFRAWNLSTHRYGEWRRALALRRYATVRLRDRWYQHSRAQYSEDCTTTAELSTVKIVPPQPRSVPSWFGAVLSKWCHHSRAQYRWRRAVQLKRYHHGPGSYREGGTSIGRTSIALVRTVKMVPAHDTVSGSSIAYGSTGHCIGVLPGGDTREAQGQYRTSHSTLVGSSTRPSDMVSQYRISHSICYTSMQRTLSHSRASHSTRHSDTLSYYRTSYSKAISVPHIAHHTLFQYRTSIHHTRSCYRTLTASVSSSPSSSISTRDWTPPHGPHHTLSTAASTAIF
eukprot:3155797-Rhodomonas_salina.2